MPGQARHDGSVVKPINPVPLIAMLILVLAMLYFLYGR
jgi:hypothetical protein